MKAQRLRLVLVCTDVVGSRMAGPGIRYWELAHQLAQRHDVTLVAPGLDVPSPTVALVRLGSQPWRQVVARADALLTQYVTPPLLSALQRANVRLVLDAYVPMVLEGLQHHASAPGGVRAARARTLASIQVLSLLAADAVVCASEQQRDLWIGALTALGRVTPALHDEDPSLRTFIDVVPFGLPEAAPVREGAGPRQAFGLPDDAVVALWGGGMWQWFDPTTIVEAVARVRSTDRRLHLVLLGQQHPQVGGEVSSVGTRAAARAEELGQLGVGVHLAPSWVPYSERTSWLLDADLGVSAHLALVENRFAFRTRVLDYLWAGLPCVLTAGDALADLAVSQGFGRVVGVGDAPAWAASLAELTADPGLRRELSQRALASAERFRWPRVAADLECVLFALAARAPRSWNSAQRRAAAQYLVQGAVGVARDEGISGVQRRLSSGTPAQRPA